MASVPLHTTTSTPSPSHLPIPPEVGLVVLGVGSVVFGLILFDIARRYKYPTERGQ